jgi:hypothetical protein
MFARPLKTFQVQYMKFLTEFRNAQGVFKNSVATIEKNYPTLV